MRLCHVPYRDTSRFASVPAGVEVLIGTLCQSRVGQAAYLLVGQSAESACTTTNNNEDYSYSAKEPN